MSEIREQAMLMGARAAEAVREGWLPDSIQRSDEDLTALILELRRSNQDERRRLLAAREAARDSSHKAGCKAGYVCRHRHRHVRQTYKGYKGYMPAVAARDSSHKAGRRPASSMSAPCVCLICLPYMSALCVCLIYVP